MTNKENTIYDDSVKLSYMLIIECFQLKKNIDKIHTKKMSEIKDTFLSIRIKTDTKKAFRKVANKRGIKVSEILLEFIGEQIKKEGVNSYIRNPNQIEIPMP